MAKITQDVEYGNSPSWLNTARGIDKPAVDQTMETLFKGLGNLADVGVTAVDKALETTSRDIVRTKAQKIRDDEFGVNSATTVAANRTPPTDARGEPTIMPDGTVITGGTSSKGAPPGVTKLGGTLTELDDAYKAGMLSPSYYYARVNSVVRQTVAQFPPYEKQIREEARSAVGFDAPNALRTQLLADVDAKYKAANAEQNKFWSFITKDGNMEAFTGYPGGGNQLIKDLKSGELTQEGAYARVFNYQQLQGRYKMEKMVLESGNLNRKEAADRSERVFGDYISDYVSQNVANVMSHPQVRNFIESAKNGRVDPKEADAVMAIIRDSELKLKTGAEGIMRGINPNPKQGDSPYLIDPKVGTPNSLINDPAKSRALIDQGMRQFEVIKNAVSSGKWDIVSSVGQSNEVKLDARRRDMFKDDTYVNMTILQKDNPDLLKAITQGGAATDDIKTRWLKTGVQSYLLNINTPKDEAPPPITTEIQKNTSNPNLTQKEQNQLSAEQVKGAVRVMLHPKAGDENFARSATSLFGPGNESFMKHIDVSQRAETFFRMTTPAMITKMQKVGESNPDVAISFSHWVDRNLPVAVAPEAQSLKSMMTNDPRIKLDWAEDKNQIVIKNTNVNRTPGARPQDAADQYRIPDSISRPVDLINRAVSQVLPLYEKDPTRLMDTLRAAGFNFENQRSDSTSKGGALNDERLGINIEDRPPGKTKTPSKPIGRNKDYMTDGPPVLRYSDENTPTGSLSDFVANPDRRVTRDMTQADFHALPSTSKKMLEDGNIAVQVDGKWYRAIPKK